MYTEQVTILRGHLEETLQTLDAALTYHSADDIAKQAKNLGKVLRPSNLTRALEAAHERLEGYLTEEEEDVSTT